jgi:hypothetical protein
MNNKKFFFYCVDIVCLFGLIGFAFGFAKYFNHLVYLPLVPNIFDSLFIVFCAVYFMLRLYKKLI